MPKSGAERAKVYRVKKRLEEMQGVKKEKRPPKTSAERARDYRARKKALKDAMNRLVDSDFGLSSGKCASMMPGALDAWNNDYSYGPPSVNLKDLTPTIPTTSIPAEIQRQYESKQSPSPPSLASTLIQTQPQFDFAEESQSPSLRNYPSVQDDHEIFGAFIASELKGLGNNFSLIRSVKKKIQLTILDAYETLEAQRIRKSSPSKENATLSRPHHPLPKRDEPRVKIEYAAEENQTESRRASTCQESPHPNEEYSAL